MKLIIVRHGDPDYENDTLTEKGCREAELLSERLSKLDINGFYCSPLGRARKTASYTLNKLGRDAKTCDWLREFDVMINDPVTGEKRIAWDLLPAYWTRFPDFYDKDKWCDVPLMADADMRSGIKRVNDGLDGILARHGYERCGGYYRAVRPNMDTVVFFCHFGVTCVLLGHLIGISPLVLWHGTVSLTTSVTELITEERREGVAYFRMNRFGDLSHLDNAGEPPSFSARFCEMYTNTDERHD